MIARGPGDVQNVPPRLAMIFSFPPFLALLLLVRFRGGEDFFVFDGILACPSFRFTPDFTDLALFLTAADASPLSGRLDR